MKRGGPLARRTPLKAKSQLKAKPTKKKAAAKKKVKPLGQRIKLQKTKTWAALSRYVRMRDKHCVTCPTGVAENAGHYIHNTDKANQTLGGNMLWYDIRNIHGQCVRCNKYNNGMPRPYALFLQEKFGMGILQELNQLYRTEKKWTFEELIELEERFTRLAEKIAFPLP